MAPVIIVHGGAAPVAPDRLDQKMWGVKRAACRGYAALVAGRSAIDAVETAVKCLENNEYFNAGFGAALNVNYEAEMDASIMDGRTLRAGAVASVKDVRNPVSLARCVMEQSPHVLLAGPGASSFAQEQGIPLIDPKEMVSEYARSCLDAFIRSGANIADIGVKNGTVGAVAYDSKGNLAAATSTGGLNGQAAGRVGDVPLIGNGVYADDAVGAMSCTGHGESIIKVCLAHSVIKTMERGGTPYNSIRINVDNMTKRLQKEAGGIVISKDGEVGYYCSTVQMPWAYVQNNVLYYGDTPQKFETEYSYKTMLKAKGVCDCDKEKCPIKSQSENSTLICTPR